MTHRKHECNHPDHIRYGPGSPGRISDVEIAQTASLIRENERKKAFRDFMDKFNNPLISADEKRDMFKASLCVPSSLTFSGCGKVLYRHGLAMVLSYKSKEVQEFLFDFDGEFIVIEKRAVKNCIVCYEQAIKFPIQSIELSLRTEQGEHGELLHMHATHRTSFYSDASLNSCSL